MYDNLNYDCVRLIFEHFIVPRLVVLRPTSRMTCQVIEDILKAKKTLFIFEGPLDSFRFSNIARSYQLPSENDIYLKSKFIYANTISISKVLKLSHLFPKVKTAVIDVQDLDAVNSLLKMWFFTLEDLTLIGKAPCDEKSAAFWKMIQVLPALKRLLLFDYTLDPHNTSSLVNSIPKGMNFENLEKFAVTGHIFSPRKVVFRFNFDHLPEQLEILLSATTHVFIQDITDIVLIEGHCHYLENEVLAKTLAHARSLQYLDFSSTASNFKINLRFFAENLKGKESLKKICLCISQFDVKDVASVNFLKQNPFNSVKHLVLIENFAIDEVYRQQVFLLLPFAFPILERLEVKVFSQEQMSSVSSMKMPKNIQLTVSMRGKK